MTSVPYFHVNPATGAAVYQSIRHGETEWSLSGKHTGTSDIPLTENGERRVKATGKALVGDDRLIVPRKLKHIYVSPRHRAQRTLELLDIGCHSPFPWQKADQDPKATTNSAERSSPALVTVTDDIAEWNYGDYEGITSAEIAEQRKAQGLPKWDIWKEGCPGGETPADVEKRVDRLIAEIRSQYHENVIGKPKDESTFGDVMVVAHGHILRAFAIRWIGIPLEETKLIMDAGGVGTLSYEHHRIGEPAILLGGGFVVGDDK